MAKDLQRLLLLGDSKISNNINRVSEEDLMFTFSAVAELGLSRWRPNILGNADSLYNVAHERIALVTFRQMASQHRYAFMSVNLSTIDDLASSEEVLSQFRVLLPPNPTEERNQTAGASNARREAESCV